MKIGVMIFNTDYAIRIDELAREVEGRAFDSLFVPEHTHIPASRKSPWPGGPNLPQEYWHTLDPFVALATAAAVTKRLLIGTGICLVVERDPITLAKEVASLDFMSGGRFLFGVGGGWNAEEMANHGTDFSTRWKVLRERILAMKAIWTQDEAEFHGDYVNFDRMWSYPKPVQKPHPPVLLGVNTPNARQRVIDYAEGWFPLASRAGNIPEGVADLRRRAAAAGRDANALTVSVFAAPTDEATLRAYERGGVTRAIFGLPSAGREKVLPLLDEYAKFVKMFG